MVESSRTVSSCPCGQVHGADDSLIGRVRSKVSPQARQRYSYLGTSVILSQPGSYVSLLGAARPQVDGAVLVESLGDLGGVGQRHPGVVVLAAVGRRALPPPQLDLHRVGVELPVEAGGDAGGDLVR